MTTQSSLDIKAREKEIGFRVFSQYTVRQSEVGECAEKNAGTSNCIPGQCELCEHCSCNFKEVKSEN
jgi:hypothetical protein